MAAPIGWGLASGLTLGACFIGGFVAGYIVGRADVGRAGRMRSVGAFVGGAAVVMIPFIPAAVRSYGGAVFGAAPFFFAFLLVPFLVGQRLGGGTRRRAVDRS